MEEQEARAVSREIQTAYEYSYLHDDWVTPLAEALDGATAEEALWKPDDDAKSIWQIVLHMAAWTENILERAEQRKRGEKPGRPSEGAWPALPEPPNGDDAAWDAVQKRLWNALDSLRDYLAVTPLSVMLDYGDVGYSQFDDVLCRFIHNAYHIGQITKLRDGWNMAQVLLRDAEGQHWRQVAFSRQRIADFLSHAALPRREADKILPFDSAAFQCFRTGFYFFAHGIYNELNPEFAEELLNLAVRIERMDNVNLWNQFAEQARTLLSQYFGAGNETMTGDERE